MQYAGQVHLLSRSGAGRLVIRNRLSWLTLLACTWRLAYSLSLNLRLPLALALPLSLPLSLALVLLEKR
jgi:hypothetical protein